MQKISLDEIQSGTELVLARPVLLGSGAKGFNSGVKVTDSVIAALKRLGFAEIWIREENEGDIIYGDDEPKLTPSQKLLKLKEDISNSLADIMTEQDPQRAICRIKNMNRNSVLMRKGALTEIIPDRPTSQTKDIKNFAESVLPLPKLEEFASTCRDLIERDLSPSNIAKVQLNLLDTRSESTYLFNHMANCGLYFLATMMRINADLKARGAVGSELRYAKGVRQDKKQLFFFSDEEVLSGALGAFMHDVGYLHDTMPEILFKEATLTREEHDILKKHVAVSMNILGYHIFFANRPLAMHTIENHHERLDGSGYPKMRSNFHTFSRALGLIDVFDSLVTDRPWRKKFARSKVLEWLYDNSSQRASESGDIVQTSFDRDVLLAFEQILLLYDKNETVNIYHNKSPEPVFSAIVKEHNPGRPDRPIVELESCFTDPNKPVAGKEVNLLNFRDLYIGEMTEFTTRAIR